MTDGKRVITGFDSRRLHNDNEGLASPSDERGQNVANFGACRICAIPLLSYRARGNGLCGPCTRAACTHLDVERGDEFTPDRCRACFAAVFPPPTRPPPAAPRPPAAGTVASIQAAACAAPGVVMCMVSPELNGDDVVVITVIDASVADREAVRAAIRAATPLAVASRVTFAVAVPDELAPQPPPANPPRGPAVWPMVIEEAEETERDPRLIAMMRARDKQGRAKYGVPLCANDGRNTAMDALQEALDLIAYLRKRRAEGRSSPHYWQRNVSDIAIALIDEIEREAAPPTASPGSSGEAGKQCVTCGFASPLQALEPVDGPTIDAFCPTCGWMGEVPR